MSIQRRFLLCQEKFAPKFSLIFSLNNIFPWQEYFKKVEDRKVLKTLLMSSKRFYKLNEKQVDIKYCGNTLK